MEFFKGIFFSQNNYCNYSNNRICLFCMQSSKTIFVHGHEQCLLCKNNVEPCCQGDPPKKSEP